MSDVNRTADISIRLLEHEKALIRSAAQRKRIRLSEFVRHATIASARRVVARNRSREGRDAALAV